MARGAALALPLLLLLLLGAAAVAVPALAAAHTTTAPTDDGAAAASAAAAASPSSSSRDHHQAATIALPKPTDAGYLPLEGGRGEMYYMYFEAEQPDDPSLETTPVLLWLQGGESFC
jgi:carboxypeptidase C (cathepsin A)